MTKAVVAILAAASVAGCAGPSKPRLRTLLSQCREHNREHLRLLKAYERMDCKTHPVQTFDATQMDLGGF